MVAAGGVGCGRLGAGRVGCADGRAMSATRLVHLADPGRLHGIRCNHGNHSSSLAMTKRVADVTCRACLASLPRDNEGRMFGIAFDDLLANLEKMRKARCCYMGDRCDCKFGASGKGEQTGCPELRQAIAYLKDQHEQVMVWRERQEQRAVQALAAIRLTLAAHDGGPS